MVKPDRRLSAVSLAVLAASCAFAFAAEAPPTAPMGPFIGPLPAPSLKAEDVAEVVADDFPAETQEDSIFAKPPEVFAKLIKPSPMPTQPVLEQVVPRLDVRLGPYLESLEGQPFAWVRTPDGKSRQVRKGELIETGESFQTGTQAYARLVFEDGAQVLIGPDSQVTAQDVLDAGTQRVLPVVDVRKGEVRILVPAAASSAAPQLRFLARVPNAVLGVKGTDFFLKVSAEETQIHVFHGVVGVAPTMALLRDEKAVEHVSVRERQRSAAFAEGKGINKPTVFEPGAFLLELHDKHPSFLTLWKSAARDGRTRAQSAKFAKVRNARTERLGISRGVIPADYGIPTGSKDFAGPKVKAHDRELDGPARSRPQARPSAGPPPREALMERMRRSGR